MSDKAESSDEEAPDSISFGTSRDEALSALKAAAELSKGTSQKQRKAKEEKRKRRQERRNQNTENVEITNDNLAKLNCLREKAKEALSDNQKQAPEKVAQPMQMKNTRKCFAEKDVEISNTDTDDLDGYIPFNSSKNIKRTSRGIETAGSSKLRVEVVSSKKPKVLAAESVLSFRETMLYGAGSKVKRENAKVVLARRDKVKLCGTNVFCTK